MFCLVVFQVQMLVFGQVFDLSFHLLVNYKYISVIEKDSILLDNDERIPLSRNRVTEIKRQFMQYINGGSHAV